MLGGLFPGLIRLFSAHIEPEAEATFLLGVGIRLADRIRADVFSPLHAAILPQGYVVTMDDDRYPPDSPSEPPWPRFFLLIDISVGG